MQALGTPFVQNAIRLMLLGAGELGKEVAIAAQRFGVELIAADRDLRARAMQVAHRSHGIPMLDPVALRGVIESERPMQVVPAKSSTRRPWSSRRRAGCAWCRLRWRRA